MAQLAPEIVGILNQVDTTVNGFLANPNVDNNKKTHVQDKRQRIQQAVEEYINGRDKEMQNFKKRLESMMKDVIDDINKTRS